MSSDAMKAAESAVVWVEAPSPSEPKVSRLRRVLGLWRRRPGKEPIRPAVPGLELAPLVDALEADGARAGGAADQDSVVRMGAPARAQAKATAALERVTAELGSKAFQALGDLEARARAITGAAVHGPVALIGAGQMVFLILLFVITDMFAFRTIAMEIFQIESPGRSAPIWLHLLPYGASVGLSLVFVMIGIAVAVGLKGLAQGRDALARGVLWAVTGMTVVGVLLAGYGLTMNRTGQVERSTKVGEVTSQAVEGRIGQGHMLLLGGLALATFAATTAVKFARGYPGVLSEIPEHVGHSRSQLEAAEEIRGALIALGGAVSACLQMLASPQFQAALVGHWGDGFLGTAHPNVVDRYAAAGVDFVSSPNAIDVPWEKSLQSAIEDVHATLGGSMRGMGDTPAEVTSA